jgi:putative nucleotidyltransferase with HDIG domain
MTASEIVAKARNLPQVSQPALRLTELLGQADEAEDEVVQLLRSDSLLTAKLLRVCNSSALGLAERVSSVDHAVLLLGHRQVLTLVLSLSYGGAMSVALPGYEMKANDLWRHALLAATAAEAISRRGSIEVDAAMAFTVGLLHDIGKLLVAQALPPKAHSAINSHILNEGLGTIEAERRVVGTDHAEVGSCLLYVWRLPDSIVEAVAQHHRPVLAPVPQLSALAHLANRIAHLADEEPGENDYGFNGPEQILECFGMDQQSSDELVALVRGAKDRVKSLMD